MIVSSMDIDPFLKCLYNELLGKDALVHLDVISKGNLHEREDHLRYSLYFWPICSLIWDDNEKSSRFYDRVTLCCRRVSIDPKTIKSSHPEQALKLFIYGNRLASMGVNETIWGDFRLCSVLS